MALSFTQASFAVAFAAGVHPSKAGTFEARIKQWQKMGFPDGVNVGRGVRAHYGATQLCQLALLLKLLTIGLTPERAIQVIRVGWRNFRDAFAETASCMAAGSDHLHYCLIKLDALTELREPDVDHFHTYVGLATSHEIAESLMEPDEGWSEEDRKAHERFALSIKNQIAVSITLEIDSLLILLWMAVEASGGSLEMFQDEFALWYKERADAGIHEQPSIEFFFNYHQTSPASATDFNALEAARTVLAKVNNDRDPEA